MILYDTELNSVIEESYNYPIKEIETHLKIILELLSTYMNTHTTG